jgi:hypothetical protein
MIIQPMFANGISGQTNRTIPKTYGGTYMPGNDCFFECMLPEK